jgi:tetratricopeptide (TPR) repeat protein
MPANPQRFADLLTEAIHRIRTREGKPIRVIQDELGYQLGRQGGSTIEWYRKGHLPPTFDDVEQLARELVRRGHMSQEWLEAFLRAAQYSAPDQFWANLIKIPEAQPPNLALPVVSQPPSQLPAPASMADASSLPVDALPSPAPLPPGSKMPLARNPLFVGREQDLIQLARTFNNTHTAAVGQIETAAATGLGGIGKTQLACEFVHRYGQFFPGGVYWLSFDNAQAIPAEIASCGGPGGLELRPDFGKFPLEDQVRIVLAAWQSPQPRLLIFDNCEEPELLRQWRPTSGGCRVLLTSRRGDWEQVLGVQLLALGVLSRSESIALLQHLCPTLATELSDAIAEELGDLPLALHLAGSYLNRYRWALTATDYLEQLRNPALLLHPSLQGTGISPTGHIQHVGRTFALSYDRLDLTTPIDLMAQRLLVCMAHFAPGEPIWYELLVKMVCTDGLEPREDLLVIDAFARLVELGLVERTEEGGPDGIQVALRMHRLVAAFVRQVAAAEMNATQERVEQTVFGEMTRINRVAHPLPLLARHVHLRAVVDLAKVRDDIRSADLCAEWGKHLYQVGNFADAQLHFEKALSIRLHLLGDDDIKTADSQHDMGDVLREIGDLPQAKEYFYRALTIRERLLGPEHLDTAATLNGLGHILLVERNGIEAEQCLRRAWKIAMQQLGVDHKLTADYANNLGLCLQDCLGDLPQARIYLEQALQTRLKVLEPDHPLTGLSQNNMGYLYQALKEYELAQHHYEQALAIRQSILGDSHPDTAQTWNNLGTLHRITGNFAQSQVCLEQALQIYLRAVGENHFRTAFCLNNFGILYQTQGDLKQAQQYFQRALTVRRNIYKAGHPNLAVSLHNLGVVLAAQGDHVAARPLLVEALTIRNAALGADDPQSQATLAALTAL